MIEMFLKAIPAKRTTQKSMHMIQVLRVRRFVTLWSIRASRSVPPPEPPMRYSTPMPTP